MSIKVSVFRNEMNKWVVVQENPESGSGRSIVKEFSIEKTARDLAEKLQGEHMIIKDLKEKKELDKILEVDKNGDPIYKIDGDNEEAEDEKPDVGDSSNSADESEFKDTPQDLKDTTSEE